jgi:hypothetical protein
LKAAKINEVYSEKRGVLPPKLLNPGIYTVNYCGIRAAPDAAGLGALAAALDAALLPAAIPGIAATAPLAADDAGGVMAATG